jgi:hypothetical protein
VAYRRWLTTVRFDHPAQQIVLQGDPPAQGGHGGRNAERDFHGEKRRNGTHHSTTDSDARL